MIEVISRADAFRAADPHGFMMAIIAMTVVFAGLVTLFLIFWGMGLIFKQLGKPQKSKGKLWGRILKAQKTSDVTAAVAAAASAPTVAGDVYAAIAVALFQYSRDLHDVEKTVLTINRAAKAYSPWSSKIYGLRQIPDKR